MGFIVSSTGSATSTVQAIHTLQGRQILARNDEEYRIAYYALSDDEINYQVIDTDASIDTYDADIALQPILEPSSNALNECQYKIWVGKNNSSDRLITQQQYNMYVAWQLNTGAQCILNSGDVNPFAMLTFHTITTNPQTLQREANIDEYRITLSNTNAYVENGIDFFRFFDMSFIYPTEGTTFLNKTIQSNKIEYIFKKINSSGEKYTSNENGMKALGLEIMLNKNDAAFASWVQQRKKSSNDNLLYEAAITIEAVNVQNFNSYSMNPDIAPATINILVKI
jgi:hypothetical protein